MAHPKFLAHGNVDLVRRKVARTLFHNGHVVLVVEDQRHNGILLGSRGRGWMDDGTTFPARFQELPNDDVHLLRLSDTHQSKVIDPSLRSLESFLVT